MADSGMASKKILRQVAKMAFEEGLTNEQIAERLASEGTFKNPNTKKVAQLFEEAGRWLLVREEWLSVLERDTENWELADRLLNAYPCLKDAMVIRLRPAGSDGRWSRSENRPRRAKPLNIWTILPTPPMTAEKRFMSPSQAEKRFLRWSATFSRTAAPTSISMPRR
jgi:hypothetical protein